ncbi:MAG: hypothetical protein MJZ97_02330 [Bacteroidales bacterium]|nr:hypothetical protein [Bacteroidales bacterium]
MNNTFNFDRFCKVVSLDVKRYVNQFGLTFLILCALPIVLWLLTLVFGFTMPRIARFGVAYIAVFLSAILVPAKAFGHINLQREGVSFAMLPASSLEKFLSIAIICILTPVLVMACSYVVDSLLVLLPFGGFDEFVSGGTIKSVSSYMFLEVYGDGADSKAFVMDVLGDLVSHEEIRYFSSMMFYIALFLFGNSLFKTHKTAKTLVILIVFSYAVSMIVRIVAGLGYIPAEWVTQGIDYNVLLDKVRTVKLLSGIIYALITLGLFVGTFFKVKNQKY